MSLQQWSLIADIITATAVIVSLCFLAFEVRLYARQDRQDALDLVTSRRHDLILVLAQDGELASIVWRGLAGTPRLPAHEWARFTMYVYSLILEYERTWLKFNAGALDEDMLREWEHAFTWWFKHPGMQSWWRGRHPGLTLPFTAYIDTMLARIHVEPRDSAMVAASFREWESRRFLVPAAGDPATARTAQPPAQ